MAKILNERLAVLDELTLDAGSHAEFAKGHCAMELVSWLAGEEHSDEPMCVDPTLTSLFVSINDYTDDKRRQMLKPFLPRLVGTVSVTTPVDTWIAGHGVETMDSPVSNTDKEYAAQAEMWRWTYTDLIPYLLEQLGYEGQFSYTPAEERDDLEEMKEVNLKFADWFLRSGLAAKVSNSWENEGIIHSGVSVLIEEFALRTMDLAYTVGGTNGLLIMLEEGGYHRLDGILGALCGAVEEKLGVEKATKNLAALVPNALESVVKVYE